MKRGDLVLVSGKGDYGKARPAVVVQADYLAEHLASVTVCPLTSNLIESTTIRVRLAPSTDNGLKLTSQIMVDKLQTYPRAKVFGPIGSLGRNDLNELDRALIFFLQLTQMILPVPSQPSLQAR